MMWNTWDTFFHIFKLASNLNYLYFIWLIVVPSAISRYLQKIANTILARKYQCVFLLISILLHHELFKKGNLPNPSSLLTSWLAHFMYFIFVKWLNVNKKASQFIYNLMAIIFRFSCVFTLEIDVTMIHMLE